VYCSYPTLRQLDLVSEGWIEVRDAAAKEIVFGYSDPSLESIDLVPDHADTGPTGQTGSYRSSYTNRGLEDVGYLFGRRDDSPDWDKMNAELSNYLRLA
jgi:hypothetical protein